MDSDLSNLPPQSSHVNNTPHTHTLFPLWMARLNSQLLWVLTCLRSSGTCTSIGTLGQAIPSGWFCGCNCFLLTSISAVGVKMLLAESFEENIWIQFCFHAQMNSKVLSSFHQTDYLFMVTLCYSAFESRPSVSVGRKCCILYRSFSSWLPGTVSF